MQETTLIVAIVIPFMLLILATSALLIYAIKQKRTMQQQQLKLHELIAIIQADTNNSIASVKHYKEFIYEQISLTQERFNQLAPGSDIAGIQPSDVPLNQRIVALRYAFLRAEELSTTTPQGSEDYWDTFQQTLAILLPNTSPGEKAHEG